LETILQYRANENEEQAKVSILSSSLLYLAISGVVFYAEYDGPCAEALHCLLHSAVLYCAVY
jgi:hypothetical protein